jgi:Flp pilus assembly protein TadD
MPETPDFAFRQAFALDPRSPEAVSRCLSHLRAEHRPADALLVAETTSKLAPENSQLLLPNLPRQVLHQRLQR